MRLVLAAVLAAALSAHGGQQPAWAESYVGVSGSLVLPPGGSSLRRLGGATLFLGANLSDCYSLEAAAGWMENCAYLSVQTRVHLYAFEVYDRYFGFSPFDPFFTTGVAGWIGDGFGQVGPKAGIGFLYHLTEDWAVRCDADATLGLDSRTEVVYALSVGIQRSF